MSTRFYMFPDSDEPVRLSNRLVNGMISGNATLPQYSGTRQRVLTAFLDFEEGKPLRLLRADGSVWVFDHEGGIREGLHESLALSMELAHTPKQSGTVIELGYRAKRKKLDNEYRWEPGQAELDRVIGDIWPKTKTDRLKALNSSTKRKPPLTYEARKALDAASQAFWKIPHEIEQLREPSLKSFSAEARVRSLSDPDFGHLYRAIADMADWQLEVEKRRRTGKGIWYAMIEVTAWNDGIGEALVRYSERCDSRDQAVAAARRMLADHADKFSALTTVEAELLTDLEWDRRAYPE